MGLDIVEIILECEERFGVSIPDQAVARFETPADLLAHIAQGVPVVRSSSCLTQRTFYRLRRGLRNAGWELPVLRPKTRLDQLATRREWPSLWCRLRREVGTAAWPQVEWSDALDGGKATLGDLSRIVAMHLPPHEPAAWRAWTRERLELALRRVLWEAAGVPRFEMRDHLVRDLGLG
jgi:hypothetical protein